MPYWQILNPSSGHHVISIFAYLVSFIIRVLHQGIVFFISGFAVVVCDFFNQQLVTCNSLNWRHEQTAQRFEQFQRKSHQLF